MELKVYCPMEAKITHIDFHCSVDPSEEELKRRLELSWPSVLTAEKKQLLARIAQSSAAENEEDWKLASRQLQNCLRILMTHKSSIPGELLLWLVKRICVPLAFISQFRCQSTDFHGENGVGWYFTDKPSARRRVHTRRRGARRQRPEGRKAPESQSTEFHTKEEDLKIAFAAMCFMEQIFLHYFDYGKEELNVPQLEFLLLVQAMIASIPYEYAKLRDQSGLGHEWDTSSALYKYSEWMSTKECTQMGVKARCCEVLCVQYYRVGQLDNVYTCLEEWKRSIECIADSETREWQKRDCKIVEAMLFAEYGVDKKRAKEWIRNLEKLSDELTEKGDNDDRVADINFVMGVIHLRILQDPLAAQDSRNKISLLTRLLSKRTSLLWNNPDYFKKFRRARDSARDEAALECLEKCIEHAKSESFNGYDPSGLAWRLSDYRFQQALCHERLFYQKQLKFFIDTMENKRSSSDDASTSFSAASFKLCAHHCWSPHCEHDRHCLEKDEDDEDEDEDENDEELAALGHHELESPTEFYEKRKIDSSGNNLDHLEKAIQLLDEALDNAKKVGGDKVYYVERMQSFLAGIYVTKAYVQIYRVLGNKSWPLPEQITPEFLASNKYHTIGQVQDYLDRNGTSPTEALRLSHYHYQQCSQMFTKHLDLLENYSDKWFDSMEKQKKLYVNLQNLIYVTLGFDEALYDMLSKVKNRSTEEVARCEAEYWEIVQNSVTEALVWSERGRARSLEQQLDQREQQPEIFPESRSKDLSAFYSDDQVAWNGIRSSLDTCGEGTVFLEYSLANFEGDSAKSAARCGRVYGVRMESDEVMETCLMENIDGDPMELQSLIEHLIKAMDPESQPGNQSEYDEEEVRRDLEKLYTLLITPKVARLLRRMKHIDHKLVICPSQVFTKVPFAILRNPAERCVNKGYLFQSHTISITPSLRVLKQNMERYTALQEMKLMEGEGACVALGDPWYRNEDRRLKKSGAEVKVIASLFPNRCQLLKREDATVANLLKSAKLPSERSSSQAFIHIAAHCETDDVDKKQRVLCLTEQDRTDNIMPSSSSTPPVNSDGILSAENVGKSKIEWRSHMIVLSACGSGKGEIKEEGVLNLARAFMVAGVPCSVVSQWKVEDDSTAQLMTLFYQHMLRGLDVATALRSSMQEMLDSGSSIRQWAPFMVWGLPTVCLPDELLPEDAGIGLLRRGEELIHSSRCSDAILPLKKSLKLLKAKKNPPIDDLVRCLSWLTDCEEHNYQLAQSKERQCYLHAVVFHNFKHVTMLHRDQFKADECRHLTSAVGYLDEALQYARDGDLSKRSENLNFKLDFWKETWTIPKGSGIDIVVEYTLYLADSTPHQLLTICVRSQVHLPRHLARKVDVNRLKTASRTASMMSALSNPESGSFLTDLKALEYLHEILIKPLLEDSLISATHPQTLVFIPCGFLQGVPFALLRDGAQPDGEGYLIQAHTVSMAPAFLILKYCNIQVLYHQTLRLMPDASDASLVLYSPAISQEEMETGHSEPAFAVASLFPNYCKALHGADSTIDSLQTWASLPCSYTEKYCQAFFHMEAEIVEGFAEEIETCGPFEWGACFAVVRACPSANGQVQKEVAMRLVDKILRHGIPCVVMSNYPVFDVSSDVFFTHLYTNLKSGESVGAAVRHSVLEMKVEGFDLDQWASFSVFGDPTVRLPEEMLGSPTETRSYSDLPISPRTWKRLDAFRIALQNIIRGEDLAAGLRQSRPH